MNNLVIGISGSIMLEENDYFFKGYEYSYVADNYIKSISKSNATPIILPIIEDEKQIENQIKAIDGLVLSGGYDIDPFFYNEEPLEKLQAIFPRRDVYELKLIEFAIKYKKPILGICRGFQLLNVAFGGSLYQDLSYRPNTFVKHVQNTKPEQVTQSIKIDKNSTLFEISKIETERVNSFHHLALKEIAKDFNVVALAKDGVVEAIEYKNKDLFILGVQFHPEMMYETSKFAKNIFNTFVEKCNVLRQK